MSLRLRLFLGLAALIAVMVAAQWWWARGLTRDLSSEVGNVAFEVGNSLASIFTLDAGECPEGATCEDEVHKDGVVVRRVAKQPTVVAFEKGEPDVHWVEAPSDATPPDTTVEMHRRVGDGGETHKMLIRLDVTSEDAGEEATGEKQERENRWLFAREPAPESYLTVFDAGGGEARRIRIPNEGLEAKIERFRQRMLWGSFGILGAGLLLAALLAHRVTTPLQRLAAAAREVGDGALGTQVAVAASGEVGQTIHAFNRMSSELEALDHKTRELRARRHLGEIGEIARGLAHSLRNPLNALGLSVEELAARASDGGTPDADTPGEAAALAGAARRQIRRIDHSIRSFLALASQGGGVVTDVDPGELLRDVALEALQDGRGHVRVDVDADAPALAAVEPELRAVAQALLVNAVEASPEGGAVKVGVRPAAAAGRVRIEIEDQGPGLPAQVRDRLFTPHLTTKANGSGMGLFLAHRIATTRYGGRLELEDGAAGGTRAVLELGARRESTDE